MYSASSPLDPEDVRRDERALGERVAGGDVVAGVDEQVLALRHVVVVLETGVGDDPDGHLALALVRVQLDLAGDLGGDRGVLRRPRLEDLGDAGQTTDDVRGAGDTSFG